MSAIGPGDYVECTDVDMDGVITPGGRGFRRGEICLVEEIGEDENGVWLNCVGKFRPSDVGKPEWPGWDAFWFRPIYRPKSDLIETLKQPAPDAVRELEHAR